MNSIIQSDTTACYICGAQTRLFIHHCIPGANRQASDKYGLVVRLCADCHTNGKFAVHRDPETMRKMKRLAQRRAMEFYGWDTAEWLKHFTLNYLED